MIDILEDPVWRDELDRQMQLEGAAQLNNDELIQWLKDTDLDLDTNDLAYIKRLRNI